MAQSHKNLNNSKNNFLYHNKKFRQNVFTWLFCNTTHTEFTLTPYNELQRCKEKEERGVVRLGRLSTEELPKRIPNYLAKTHLHSSR